VIKLRSFLLVKAQPGLEKDIMDRFKALPEVREIHMIAGKFDLLVTLESEETELDPRRKIVDVVVEKVRKAGGILDTRTIIPIDSHTRSVATDRPMAKGFVFVQSEAGKERELMDKLFQVPEVCGVHLLFGKSDVLAELEVEKSFVSPPPRRIANIVETRVARLSGVHDTDTYVPLESVMK